MGTEAPRHWRLRQQRYGLIGEMCPHCETIMFPPRDICINCGGVAKGTVEEVNIPFRVSSPMEASMSSK